MQKRVQNQMRISSKNEFFKLPFFCNILFNKKFHPLVFRSFKRFVQILRTIILYAGAVRGSRSFQNRFYNI